MKYLIEIHHGIGDVVQMTGVIESIIQYDKKAYVALILNKKEYQSLFENDRRVQQFYWIDFREMSKLQIAREVLRMRRERFDCLLLSPISNQKASRVLAFLAGAKISVGEQLKKENKRKKRVEIQDVHIVQRNENVLRTLKPEVKKFQPKLIIDGINISIRIPQKTIGFCIGTSIPQKTWELNNYLETAERFLLLGYHVVLLGGKKEANLLKTKSISNKILNLTGKLSLIESAKAVSLCDLVIGGDTGVMHIAAAVGATTLTLFSCTNPRLHSPYSEHSYYYSLRLPCQYCYERGEASSCINYECISNISIDTIFQISKSILEGNVDLRYKFSL